MVKIDPEKAVEVKPNIWWVGWPDYNAGFANNPYIIKDGNEVILIDPGSRLEEHWSIVKRKIESIIPLNKITMAIVTHQDPDLCAALPFVEEACGIDNFEVVTTERTSLFVPYYGVRTAVTTVTDGDLLEVGESGRELLFMTTPYLHFPGAMVVYDTKEKVLFSSDIFGAFSVDWSLYANKYYAEAVKSFAEPYLSDKRHVTNFLKKIEPLEIEMICPQHGSIIPKDRIQEMIDALKGLEVGIWK
ncbi:MAG: MBL fold metallo-hydrolase [Candidatus Heimdallarchaeota archaeon]|nr:MBL fold metallo-hydrolase [Candidatus Heimdallarchaeota archaeon]